MTLFAISRNGSVNYALSVQLQRIVLSWWEGNAQPIENEVVTTFLQRLHQDRLWLACSCRDESLPPEQRPVLVPAMMDKTIYLRRLHTRTAHMPGCFLSKDQALQLTEADLGHKTFFNGITEPSFLVEDYRNTTAAGQLQVSERDTHGGGKGQPRSTHASRLFWVAEKSGWQTAPSEVRPLQALLAFAQSQLVGPLSLKSILFSSVRGWKEMWPNRMFNLCRTNGLPSACWWVQLIESYDVTRKVIGFANNEFEPLHLPVRGQMGVFGGDISAARFPMVAICSIRSGDAGPYIASSYAHPVLDRKRWMLVDSDLERQTYFDLAEYAVRLLDLKLSLTIRKPLHPWPGSSERPDFVLELQKGGGIVKHLAIETMGFDDPDYLSRKNALAKNLPIPTFFDDRPRFQHHPNPYLAEAITHWIARG